jgi:hypothetical protein
MTLISPSAGGIDICSGEDGVEINFTPSCGQMMMNLSCTLLRNMTDLRLR